MTKSIEEVRFITRVADAREAREAREEDRTRRVAESRPGYDAKDTAALIAELEKEMKEAAAALDFETAARLRDQLFEIKAKADGTGRVREVRWREFRHAGSAGTSSCSSSAGRAEPARPR